MMTDRFSAPRLASALGRLACGVVAALVAITPAQADSTWDELKPDVFGDRPILNGAGVISLSAPKRPKDQSAVPLGVKVRLPDGRSIKSVSFIVDENPSPVAAVFDFGDKRNSADLAARFRLNEATDVRAVVETHDGALYMVEQHVKFAGGQAACAAPPAGDPAEIAANMGRMAYANTAGSAKTASSLINRGSLTVSHPNHTGMVLDQITLLYVPLRIVTDIEVRQGKQRVFAMKGSMTLAQDPTVEFDFRRNGADTLEVTVRDSEGADWAQRFPIGPGT